MSSNLTFCVLTSYLSATLQSLFWMCWNVGRCLVPLLGFNVLWIFGSKYVTSQRFRVDQALTSVVPSNNRHGTLRRQFPKFLLHTSAHCSFGWRVGVWLSSLDVRSLRKLRPRVELQRSQGRRVRTLATEQKRNVRPANAHDTCQVVENAGCETVKRPSCKWKGQTDADEEST